MTAVKLTPRPVANRAVWDHTALLTKALPEKWVSGELRSVLVRVVQKLKVAFEELDLFRQTTVQKYAKVVNGQPIVNERNEQVLTNPLACDTEFRAELAKSQELTLPEPFTLPDEAPADVLLACLELGLLKDT